MPATYTNNANEELYNERKKQFYNVDDLMDIINNNFQLIKNADKAYYGKYNIKIENEQHYIPDEDRKDQNTIYIAVKFQRATLDYSQVIIPIVFTAISEKNALDVCQRLLLEYCQTFNLTDGSGYSNGDDDNVLSFVYKQTYDTPNSTSHFNEVYDGYRSTFIMTGNIAINYGINPIKQVIYYPNYISDENTGEGLIINTLSNGFSYTHSLDPQPYSGRNKTKSIVKYGTFSFAFESYLQDNALFNKCLLLALCKELRDKDNTNFEPIGGSFLINDNFAFGLVFNNQETLNNILTCRTGDDSPLIVILKLKDFSLTQNIGKFPGVKLSFAE